MMPTITNNKAVILSQSDIRGSASTHRFSDLLTNGNKSHRRPHIPSTIYVELSKTLILFSHFIINNVQKYVLLYLNG